MAAKIDGAHMTLPQSLMTMSLDLGDEECDTGQPCRFALCYRSHPERFDDVRTFCLSGVEHRGSILQASGMEFLPRLKFSGIEKEKFVMGVTQRTRKLR